MTARPIAPFRHPLRRDPRGWQIEDDDAAERLLQALEAFGLILAELTLHRFSRLGLDHHDHDLDLALRGLGTLAGRVGMSRLSWLTGVDETGRRRADHAQDDGTAAAIGERMRAVLDWLLVWNLADPDAPPAFRPPTPPPPAVRLALDELHAAAVYLDRRLTDQGLPGPGNRRRMARTTTRRSTNGG